MYTSLWFLHKLCVEFCKVGAINSSIFLINISENISSPPNSDRINVCWSDPIFILIPSFVKVRCMTLDNTRSVKCKHFSALILPESSLPLLTHGILSVRRPAPNWGNSTTNSNTKRSNNSRCQFLFDKRPYHFPILTLNHCLRAYSTCECNISNHACNFFSVT